MEGEKKEVGKKFYHFSLPIPIAPGQFSPDKITEMINEHNQCVNSNNERGKEIERLGAIVSEAERFIVANVNDGRMKSLGLLGKLDLLLHELVLDQSACTDHEWKAYAESLEKCECGAVRDLLTVPPTIYKSLADFQGKKNVNRGKTEGDRTVVTLIGSTKFRDEYRTWAWERTKQGFLVLYTPFSKETMPDVEENRDELEVQFFQRIRMSDVIFVYNKGGYIGEHTRMEMDYAKSIGKRIVYLEHPLPDSIKKLNTSNIKPRENALDEIADGWVKELNAGMEKAPEPRDAMPAPKKRDPLPGPCELTEKCASYPDDCENTGTCFKPKAGPSVTVHGIAPEVVDPNTTPPKKVKIGDCKVGDRVITKDNGEGTITTLDDTLYTKYHENDSFKAFKVAVHFGREDLEEDHYKPTTEVELVPAKPISSPEQKDGWPSPEDIYYPQDDKIPDKQTTSETAPRAKRGEIPKGCPLCGKETMIGTAERGFAFKCTSCSALFKRKDPTTWDYVVPFSVCPTCGKKL